MGSSAAQSDFVPHCKTMVQHLLTSGLLKPSEIAYFRDPIDAVKFPDYYSTIQHPTCLSEIYGKLDLGLYPTPDAFYDDMSLVFSNCRGYNHPSSEMRKLGQKLEAAFEEAWAKAPFMAAMPANSGTQQVPDLSKVRRSTEMS